MRGIAYRSPPHPNLLPKGRRSKKTNAKAFRLKGEGFRPGNGKIKLPDSIRAPDIKLSIQELISRYKKKQETGHLFIVSGPSGAGKTLLCKEATKIFPRLLCSTSYTTRTKRPQEVDGQDYFFLTPSEFEHKIEQGDFLEWAKVHGNYYGTCRQWVTEKLSQNLDVILDIDVQGAKQIYQQKFPCCLIFVTPPSQEILIQRLVGRASDTEEDIAQRLKNAEEELKNANNYHYLIVNDKLPEAVDRLTAIILAQKSLLNPLPNS